MKAPVLLIILFFVVAVSAWSYYHKFSNVQDDMDKLANALHGVKDVVQGGSAISIGGNVDITIRSQSRYILAPGIVLADHKDTSLMIYPVQDSAMPAGKIIWQHTDERFKYYITTSHAE
ncbi:MAG: hypothetical protein H3C54_07795 [Taibaiella sp.]|nr:hypothetical protein [Taibaiella sp.]